MINIIRHGVNNIGHETSFDGYNEYDTNAVNDGKKVFLGGCYELDNDLDVTELYHHDIKENDLYKINYRPQNICVPILSSYNYQKQKKSKKPKPKSKYDNPKQNYNKPKLKYDGNNRTKKNEII